jgi:hypothetical protein
MAKIPWKLIPNLDDLSIERYARHSTDGLHQDLTLRHSGSALVSLASQGRWSHAGLTAAIESNGTLATKSFPSFQSAYTLYADY